MADVVCGLCGNEVVTDNPVKVWTALRGIVYHDLCLASAVEAANKYRQVEDIVRDRSASLASRCIIDVWVCALCGGRSGGYGREKCLHCGAKAHYGSGNGHYEQG